MPQPLRGQAGGQAAVPKTRLRIPFYLDLDTVSAAIRAQFPDKEVIETRADNLSTPIKVRVKDVTLFPSRQLVGMELSLDVVSPSNWLGLQGKAHLVGRAVVKPDGREIVLENIGFPMLMQIGRAHV